MEIEMTKAMVSFIRMVQDSQEFGSNDEHMVSRVFFDLAVDDHQFPGLYCNVKQTVGSSYEDGPLEVSKPQGYRGPMNHDAFSASIERYYRGLIGRTGVAIKLGLGPRGTTRMKDNHFHRAGTDSFDVSNDGTAW